jgi:hypothetical protein
VSLSSLQGGNPVGGLDVLAAFTAMAKVPPVLVQAVQAVQQYVQTGSGQALLAFLPSGLPPLLEEVRGWAFPVAALGIIAV